MSVAVTGSYSNSVLSGTAPPISLTIAVPANTNFALFHVNVYDGTLGNNVPTSLSFAGVNLPYVAATRVVNVSYVAEQWFYFPNPPIGTNTLIFSGPVVSWQYILVTAIFFSGVNTGAPFGALPISAGVQDGATNTLTINPGIAGTINDLYVGSWTAGASTSTCTSASNIVNLITSNTAFSSRWDTLAGNTGSAQFVWTSTAQNGVSGYEAGAAALIKAQPSNIIFGLDLGMDYRAPALTSNGTLADFLVPNSLAAVLPFVGITVLDSTGFDLSNATSITNPSTTYTCPTGTDMLVLTWTTAFGSGGANPTAVTYNSVAMTHVPGAANVNGNFATDIWYLANPATGASHTLAITCAAQKFVAPGVLSLKGTAPLFPVSNTPATTGGTNTPSLSATGGITGDLYIACCQLDATLISDGGGQTQRWLENGSGSGIQTTTSADGVTIPGANSGSFSWSPGGSVGAAGSSATAICLNSASKSPIVQFFTDPSGPALGSGASGASYSQTLSVATTLGNTLVVMACCLSPTAAGLAISGISDNLANTWTGVEIASNGSSSNLILMNIWSAPITTAGTTTITITWTGSTNGNAGSSELSFVTWELSGITGVDQHTHANTNGTSVTATCPGANSFSDDFVIAGFQQSISSGTPMTHPPASTGYWVDAFFDLDSANFHNFQRDYAMRLCTTTETSSVTFAPPSTGFIMAVIASFKRH